MFELTGLLWWQWWILIMVTLNTTINTILFFSRYKRK